MNGRPGPPAPPAPPVGDVGLLGSAGAVVGLTGLLLAAATTVWPTMVLSLPMPEVGDFTRGSERSFWAWGRDVVSYTSNGLVLDDDLGPHPVPRLVMLALVLLLAAVALVAVLVRPGRRGELLGATATALALATVAASAMSRWSFDDRTALLQPGVRTVTTAAGWCENAAVGLLVLALVLLLGPQTFPRAGGALAARAVRAWRRLREADEEAPAQVGFTDDVAAGPG